MHIISSSLVDLSRCLLQISRVLGRGLSVMSSGPDVAGRRFVAGSIGEAIRSVNIATDRAASLQVS